MSDLSKFYRALELQEGAAPEEIKRAYFRLVRRYTPEKDPERFRQIREAYEALKDGPQEEQEEDFEPPEDAIARMFLQFAMDSLKNRNARGAIRNLESAAEVEPENPLILRTLIQQQLRTGHSQKAAKNAEKLCGLKPDSQQAWTLLSMALLDRGWIKKALPAFRKAHALGNNSPEFLNGYSYTAVHNGEREEASRINRKILEREKWNKDSVGNAVNAYGFIALFDDLSGKGLKLFLEEYLAFLRRNRRLLDDPEDVIGPFVGLISPDSSADLQKRNNWLDVCSALREVIRIKPEMASRVDAFLASSHDTLIDQDERVKVKDWHHLCVLKSPELDLDPMQLKFATSDVQMCILMEKERHQADARVIRQDYPWLYEQYPEFIDALADGKSNEMFKTVKREFDRISGFFESSHYAERYGKKDSREREPDFLTADAEDPYVREKEKVGRNDPCPCGSGKKFKKCCMGKGIYD